MLRLDARQIHSENLDRGENSGGKGIETIKVPRFGERTLPLVCVHDNEERFSDENSIVSFCSKVWSSTKPSSTYSSSSSSSTATSPLPFLFYAPVNSLSRLFYETNDSRYGFKQEEKRLTVKSMHAPLSISKRKGIYFFP